MKKGFILLAAAGFVIISGISYSIAARNDKAGGTAPQSASASTHKIINVNDLAANPAAFQGNIILRGVVAGINNSQKIFGVIDVNEFKNCGTLLCSHSTLPVKYTGNPPKLKSIVNIIGRLTKNNKGMIIEARSIQVVK